MKNIHEQVTVKGIDLNQVAGVLPKKDLTCDRGTIRSAEVVMSNNGQPESRIIYACGRLNGRNKCGSNGDKCGSALDIMSLGEFDILNSGVVKARG